GPPCIDSSRYNRGNCKDASHDEDVPAQQVQSRERQISRSNHHRNQKVSKHGGYGWNQEEKDHDDTVHRKQFVVGLGLDEVTRRGQQLQADKHGEKTSKEEKQRDGYQVQQCDSLVVSSEKPRLHAVADVQVMLGMRHIILAHRSCLAKSSGVSERM